MKRRVVVVDFGEVVHARKSACPPWCHLCPHMDGGVMPYCFGSVTQNADEFDLLHCTCDPCDPVVTHVDLVSRTDNLVRLLRDKRRDRRSDRQAVKRLFSICRAMKWSSDQRGIAEAFKEIEGIAKRLESALTADAVDPHADSTGTPSTRDGKSL